MVLLHIVIAIGITITSSYNRFYCNYKVHHQSPWWWNYIVKNYTRTICPRVDSLVYPGQ